MARLGSPRTGSAQDGTARWRGPIFQRVGDQFDLFGGEHAAGGGRRAPRHDPAAQPEPDAGLRPDAPLASRVRPRRFEDLVGQRETMETLRALATSGHLPNVGRWGPPRAGKTTADGSRAERAGGRVVA